MIRSDIRPAELKPGESVAVIDREGTLKAVGKIESVEPRRFSSVTIVVAGIEFSLSTFKCELAVVRGSDYEKHALPMAQGQWMEVIGRKCRHVRNEMPSDVRAKVVALARELEALVDPYIEKVDESRGVDFRSHEGLRGNHALSESESLEAMHRELFSALYRDTESQAAKVPK